MEYSPFVDRLQQDRVQPPFKPLDLPSPTAPNGPLSAQSSIGPSLADAFSTEHTELASPLAFGGNPFHGQMQPHAQSLGAQRPLPSFSFSSQPASPIEREPFTLDPIESMSLDPRPRRQRGHRRAQSDFFEYPQGFAEEHEEGFLNFEMGQQAAPPNGHSRTFEFEHMDAAELQNILKSRSAENLALDPKKAKRIIANRQSAARSKEKKVRYIADLETRLQQLQSEATSMKTLMSMLQKDTTSLTSEHTELQQRLQALENQAQLRDGLNERLRQEVMHLKQQAQQLQQRPLGQSEGNSFSQEGLGDRRIGVGDFLNLTGSIESPSYSNNQGQEF